ncbi:unnamed protein product [Prorocentrum cordatum]|uniref:RNA helicase n=1 Tax=Prorocentrum cordatum TaxID=2364126 RepID=A0ABN9V463_9DINO|nr:unnamed protein product [Polarella glacialis]
MAMARAHTGRAGQAFRQDELRASPARRIGGPFLWRCHGPMPAVRKTPAGQIDVSYFLLLRSAIAGMVYSCRSDARLVKGLADGRRCLLLVARTGRAQKRCEQQSSRGQRRRRVSQKRGGRAESEARAARAAVRFLERVARRIDTVPEYYELLVQKVVSRGVVLSVDLFASLLVTLMGTIPVREDFVRLTLNMACPVGSKVLALSADSARGCSDDGLLIKSEPDQVNPARLCGHVRILDKDSDGFDVDDDALSYFSHFVILLHLEAIASMRAVEERLLLPLEEQDSIGLTLRDLRIHTMRNFDENGSQRIRFFSPPGADWFSKTRLRSGDTVMLSRSDPLHDGIHAIGTVIVDKATGALEIETEARHRLSNRMAMLVSWRIDSVRHWSTYTRQLDALCTTATKAISTSNRQRRGNVLCLMKTIISAYRVCQATESDWQREASTGPSVPQQDVTKLHELKRALTHGHAACQDPERQLNDSQLDALTAALTGRLTLIQGPPGTGKTYVSVHLLKLFTKVLCLSPVLAVADSNIAVDNMAMEAHRMGLNVVRVGDLDGVHPDLRSLSLESMMAQGFSSKAVLSTAEVICMTNCKAGSALVQRMGLDAEAILVDEAAQSTELSVLVPLALCGAPRLVLVGDQCQLPPTVVSQDPRAQGLSLSLFGRLVARGLTPHMLKVQYRMHPKLAEFISQQFYRGLLATGVDSSSRAPPAGFAWPRPDAGIAIVDARGDEVQVGFSWTNPVEVSVVADVLAGFLGSHATSPSDVGIVSPYSAQVRSLQRELRRRMGAAAAGVEVKTVDGFQGREKQIMIVSTVRSNHFGVGFLSDWRRLNVMLTRARCGLVVVGNAATLEMDPTWARWLDWARVNDFIV